MNSVIFCTNGVFPAITGGIQRHTRLLVEELARTTDLTIHVIHPHEGKVFDPSFTNIKEISIQGVDLKKFYLFEIYRYSKRMHEALTTLPSDIPIYCQGFSLYHRLRQFGHRVIYNPHGLEQFQAVPRKEYIKHTPFRWYTRRLFRHAARVVSLGGKLTDIIRSQGVPAARIRVIPNAVIPPRQLPLNGRFSDKVTRFLFVSRFASNKGIHILMEAISQLNREGHAEDTAYLLVGKGPLYQQYVDSLKEPNVRLAGFVGDEALSGLYASHAAFVFPTMFEGMPTVILEAMAQGMPIIASDVGAVAELVEPGKNGYLIRPNDVASLKNAILEFLELNETERMDMSRHSFTAACEKYSWERVARMTHELINEVGEEVGNGK